MKYKLYIKNIIQIIISIFMGWISFWWLGFAYIEITEVDDLDSLWLRPYAMTMFIVGIGIVISKEIIMFRKNILFGNCFLQDMLRTLREICSNKKDASLVLSRYTIPKVKNSGI